MKLRSEQKRFVEYAAESLRDNRFAICEAPTAFGKTISALALAKELLKKAPNKRVIIATASNSLAKEILNEAKRYENELPSFALGVGKSNYLDVNKIVGGITLDLDRDKALKAIEELKAEYDFVFIDEFLDLMDVVDQGKRDFYKDRLAMTDSNSDNFLPYQIQITNYSYLLLQIMYGEYERLYNPNDTYFIFDEVQEFLNLAELTLNSKFSLYSYYLNVKALNERIRYDSVCPASIKKTVEKEYLRAESLYKIHSKPGNNKTETDRKECLSKAKALYSVLFGETVTREFERSVRRLLEKYGIGEAKYMIRVIEEGKATLNSEDIYISYSKERGYVSFQTYTRNIDGLLAVRFWNRLNNFCGVTATALTGMDTQSYDPYTRLGINIKHKSVEYEDKITGERKSYEVSSKLDKIRFIRKFKGVLSPDQAVCVINPNEFIVDDEERFSKYASYIASRISDKNAMILAGGYDEVNTLKEKLSALTNVPITVAAPNRSQTNVIADFKKTGGILIGTRNYATGVNLTGKQLEQLFITKLPYPQFSTKKWIDLKERNTAAYWKKMNTEMTLTFRQAIGRLIRTPTDKGELYILDGRYNSKQIKNVLDYFVKQVSTIIN